MSSFDKQFRELAARVDDSTPTKCLGADRVAVSEIRRAPLVFAARSSGREKDHGGSNQHASALDRALRAMPVDRREFDPITVYEIAGADYCVDGHHRLAVYQIVLGADATVPVVRIGGSLPDAVEASIKTNSKTFLPMSQEQRHEAAWKLVKIGHGSKREQAEASGMGETFIATLRRLKGELEASHPGEGWGSLWEAKRLATGTGGHDWTTEDDEAETEEYQKRLLKAFGSKLHRRTPHIVLALVRIVGPDNFFDAFNDKAGQEFGIEFGDDDEDDDERANF